MVMIKSSEEGAARPSVCKWCGETKERKAVLSEEEAARPLLRASLCPRKLKMHWTHGQHHLFLDAIDYLGPENATPKKILKSTNLSGLTAKHITSHLQKHRKFMKEFEDKTKVSNSTCQTNASSLQVILPNTGDLSIPNPMFANSGANNNPHQTYPSNGQAIWPNSGGPRNLQIPSWNPNPHQTYASNGQAIWPNSGGSRNLPIPSLGPTNVMTGLTDPESPLPVSTAANASASLHFSPAPTTQPPVARIERRNPREHHVMKNAAIDVNSRDQQKNCGHGYLHDVIYYQPANKGQEGIPDQGVISSSSGTDMNGPSNELQKIDIQLNGHDNKAPENWSPLASSESSHLRQGNNENCTIHLPEPTPPISDPFLDTYPNNYHEDAADKLLHDGCLKE